MSNIIERAINYPYKQNPYSFVYHNGKDYEVENYLDKDKSILKIDGVEHKLTEFLEINNLNYLDLNNSYVVLAYGSNSSFEQLKRKFENIENVFIPVLKCKIKGIDVVYSGHITKYGALPATIQGSTDTIVEVSVTLLSEKFLQIMHKTESLGSAYNFVELNNIELIIDNNYQLNNVYSYISIAGCFELDKSIVGLSSIKGINRKSKLMSEEEVLESAALKLGVKIENKSNLYSFILNCIKDDNKRLYYNKVLKNSNIPYEKLNFIVKMNNVFKVKGTNNNHRAKSPKDYVIAVNPELKKNLKLTNQAIVLRNIQSKLNNKPIQLRTFCNVIVDTNATDEFIFADQSIREALAIPFGYDFNNTFIEIHKLNIPFYKFIANIFVNLFDRRFIYFRVFSGVIFDIEKNIARTQSVAFEILGIENGGKIVIEGLKYNENKKIFELKSITLTLFELPNDWVPKQNNLETFDIPRDILPITLDAKMREDLGIDLLSCVKARRNILKLFIEEFRTSGIITILTLFTILEILPIDLGSWFNLIPNIFYIFVITLLLMIINIRSSLK